MRQSGNIMPCAPEIEDALIGAILLEPFVLHKVIAMLKPNCFYKADNTTIYNACINLYGTGKTIDLLTVTQKLKALNQLDSVGGPFGVSVKTNRVASSANAESHAAIIYEKFVLRELIRISNKIGQLCEEPKADALDILETVFKEFQEVDFIGKSNVQHVGDAALKLLDEIKAIDPNGVRPGITTGHKGVDIHYTKQKQDLTIIAARPSQGKTVYMLSLAKHTAINLKKPVGIFSLEMSTTKLVGRLMASEANVSSKNINEKRISSGELLSLGGGISRLIDAPIYIDDSAGVDIMSLRSKIRKMKQTYGVEEIYIDYLQLMASKEKGNREQEISHISRNLKMIAKEEDIPITALSQLSRKVEERPDKKPQLSDLRESGAIEQDADTVFFLLRPEYYGLGQDTGGEYQGQTFNGRNLSASGLMLIDCAKYREGALFLAPLLFNGQFMQITDHPSIYPDTEFTEANPLETNTDFLNQ